MNKIWQDAKAHRIWFAALTASIAKHDGGAFMKEIVEDLAALEGRPANQPISEEVLERLRRDCSKELMYFNELRLISLEMKSPKRLYPPREENSARVSRPPLISEFFWSIAKKGNQIRKISEFWQNIFFFRHWLWERIRKKVKIVKAVVFSVAPVFGLLKLVLQWPNEKALIGAAVAGIVGGVIAFVGGH